MPRWRRRAIARRRDKSADYIVPSPARYAAAKRPIAATWTCKCPAEHPQNRHRCKRCRARAPR